MNAQKIIETLKQDFLTRDFSANYLVDNISQVLACLAKVFARERLENNTVDELIQLIKQENPYTKVELSQRLYNYLSELIKENFLWQDESILAYAPKEVSANIFYGYWIVLSNLVDEKNLIPYNQETREKLFYFLRIVKGYKMNLRHQNLQNANLSYVELIGADLSYANLKNAVLLDSDLSQASIHNAILTQAKMDNIMLNNADLSFSNLQKASLVGAELNKATLHAVDLSEADLSDSELVSSNLDNSNLYQTNLTLANLQNSSICKADMRGIDLSKANLQKAKLDGSVLKGAKLYDANFQETSLTGVFLKDAQTYMKADFRNTKIDKFLKNHLERQGAKVDE